MPHVALVALLSLALCGCYGSRWARRNECLQAAKYAIDARHVAGKQGVYGSAAGMVDPDVGGFEGGVFEYGPSYAEGHLGGAVYGREGKHPVIIAATAGGRLQAPTRVAPFVGLHGYLGYMGLDPEEDDENDEWEESYEEPSFDNQNNDHVLVDILFDVGQIAVAPEVGMHVWLDRNRRVTLSARFFVSSLDEDNTFAFVSAEYATFGEMHDSAAFSSPPPENLDLNYYVPPPEPEPIGPNPYASLSSPRPGSTSAVDAALEAAGVEPVASDVPAAYPGTDAK